LTKLRREAGIVRSILYSIGRTLASRIRADNKKIKDSVNLARAAGREEPFGPARVGLLQGWVYPACTENDIQSRRSAVRVKS